MNEATHAAQRDPAPANWPRRALMGLWLIAFVVATVSVFLRWDSLISRLAEPPAASEPAGDSAR